MEHPQLRLIPISELCGVPPIHKEIEQNRPEDYPYEPSLRTIKERSRVRSPEDQSIWALRLSIFFFIRDHDSLIFFSGITLSEVVIKKICTAEWGIMTLAIFFAPSGGSKNLIDNKNETNIWMKRAQLPQLCILPHKVGFWRSHFNRTPEFRSFVWYPFPLEDSSAARTLERRGPYPVYLFFQSEKDRTGRKAA